ncbi:MAG: autotransporter outer membrane beta-barrel domain-containing protein [Proteobacteria bacterium]|nr:autotransporter outer membrane beta-barrel domain-containing protein [Pseudomonadota bacterium]
MLDELSTGVRTVRRGRGGNNGRAGLLFIPPADGGNGNAPAILNYQNTTNILATDRIGIEAGSIGGNGGKGGASIFSFWSPGDGGNGGAGGTVVLTNNEGVQVATTANNGHGIFAYSRSGTAGVGGSGILAPSGGSGGNARDGGTVTVTNLGNVSTTGDGAFGIYGLSVGNNGGSGGSQWGLVGGSGSGGFGGSGGVVSVFNMASGTVNTTGDFAHGILAQSVGGSGGSSGTSGNLFLSLLGQADAGGDGGEVHVENDGAINTSGENSRGIFAQSIGGGGGSGGVAGALIAIGGAGSGGGTSGEVTVENNASGVIITSGSRSDGIFAQSVGAGGGGGSVAGGLVSIGGTGASGGNGGEVDVTNSGVISTSGDHAGGVVAQSIGGGGGDSGASGGVIAVGGSGDGGGDSLLVTVVNGGLVATQGDHAIGIVAQSIGGGGGNATGAGGAISVGGSGDGGGNAGGVDVTNSGVVATQGVAATGILAQSVGGGGGNGGSTAGMVAVGGSGDGGGTGGAVAVDHSGSIRTQGEDAAGILAQSVGGGGGNGGSAGAVSAFVGAAIGGTGGTGDDGGVVDISLQGGSDSSSEIRTEGDRSTGLFAQSVGGGGGNGGGSVSVAAGYVLGASIAVGGAGDAGGKGGVVTLLTDEGASTIETSGDDSAGVMLQSVGGGGGNGGYAVSVALAAGEAAGALSVGVGGSEGAAGDGGTVHVGEFDADGNLVAIGFQGDIATSGERSTGLIAQSVGGGGGNGGLAVAASGAGGAVASGAVSVGVGGNGGGGGLGGEVLVATEGDITTQGDNSTGMLVQSVGGGGGNAGGSISGALSISGGVGIGVSVGMGGDGGVGSSGGRVDLTTLESTVTTQGENSTGITVQSIGGGGGNGGYSVALGVAGAGGGAGAVSVGMGGQGGTGSVGGIVTANLQTNVSTAGDDSTGILVQSVGGGGGNGGFNVSLGGGVGASGAASVGVGLGGSGSTGGSGGLVTATSAGTITTQGENSAGFVAQSVGGGGGNGGFNVSATLAGSSAASGAVSVGLGGNGGGASDADAVIAMTSGDVQTAGENSAGILAQSVGGGGGNGGFDVSVGINAVSSGGAGAVGIGGGGGGAGDGGTVTLTVANDVTTNGTNSTGVIAQSVGGGGGNGGMSVSIAGSGSSGAALAAGLGIGGSGAGGGDAKEVVSSLAGRVTTAGQNAAGVIAQSVGGGGGNGGIAVGGSVSVASAGSGSAAVGVGGSGSGGGAAGAVTNTVTGYVQTSGSDASGVLTQSVGGGGGNGATSVSGALNSGATGGAVAVAVGGAGGAGGNAEMATSTVTGGVITTGDRSTAITTQSVGGGGGNGGVSVAGGANLAQAGAGASVVVGVGGSGGTAGNGLDVVSTVVATDENPLIGTTGNDATAILAQSVGGGGGNGGLNVAVGLEMSATSGAAIGVGVGGFGGSGGSAGDVTLDVSADVITEGYGSDGLVAQSVGGGGGNGGINVSGSVSLSSTGGANAASIGVGGFGGNGGASGEIDLDFQGTLIARPTGLDGEGSHGILAQSIAGGGGNGGVNIAGALSFASSEGLGDGNALVLGVGGFGGVGSNAASVDVFVADGSGIFSFGDDRSAILAQSIGGGGGNGAINIGAGIASDAPLVFGMGGFGGAGGSADDVIVESGADLFAQGANAHGIFAQSVGGGGGNGGLNISGALSFSEQTTVPTVTFGLGGFGGAGNTSGDVTVTQRGLVTTSGKLGHGIFAQSLAGGGGNGGMNISSALNFSGDNSAGAYNSLSLVAGIGGHGGMGADAGSTTVTSTGDIITSGDYARGIFAQSIGGGGGNGGLNFFGNLAKKSSLITMGIGGFGGGAGDAGSVTVTRGGEDAAAGVIATNGIGAIGIEASSIGGGGGDAGANIVAAIVLAEDGVDEPTPDGQARQQPHHEGVDDEVFTNYDAVIAQLQGRSPEDAGDEQDAEQNQSPYAVQIAVGGSGGGAGIGASATVNNFGDVQTLQDRSHGILAQSIGGGGGNASFNTSLTFLQEGARNTGINLALGGATGNGGQGGAVDVIHDGNIETFGDDSHGILAQSVGGGGGNVGAEMDVEGTDSGKLSISIGRRGGMGGEGGEVNLASAGTVITHGERSWGVLAQSIGNGGGNSSTTSLAAEGERSSGMTIGLEGAVGLEGGEGGAAGNVNILEVTGLVATEGNDSHAVFAQSVGGGGGNGGDAGGSASSAAISMGGTGGTGGIGGVVTVNANADIMTLGQRANGILAQSIGGGGGTGGESKAKITGNAAALLINLGGAGGDGAIGGDVDVDTGGMILTDGDNSHAVFAQSLGGGGGNGSMTISSLGGSDSADGPGPDLGPDPDAEQSAGPQLAVSVGGSGGTGARGGTVEVTNTGVLQARGSNASAIFAQSIGGGGGNASQVITNLSSSGSSTRLSLGGIPGGDDTGGTGGAGGNVTVENLRDENGEGGQILTQGDGAHGIVAMSIGGGGGTGSTFISAIASDSNSVSDEPVDATSIAVSIGGEGGSGGESGLVTVTNEGEIVTLGDAAHGVFAQSIGGGGGNGGVVLVQETNTDSFAAPIGQNVSVGGRGGDGNFSGDVIIFNSGTIDVSGDASYGVFAQSIGGGGGNGGSAGEVVPSAGDMMPSDGSALPANPPLMALSLGGAGGTGADSGDVSVTHTGTIISRGDDSFGIFAQSIAGGGGTIGASYNSAVGAARDFLLPVFLGSNAGDGTAGEVTVNTSGNIVMLGANSRASNVQSVNGGGGNLNMSVDVSQLGQDENPGAGSAIGGSVVLGSVGAQDSAGSLIRAGQVGDLVTLGRNSTASLIQSVGGGGGTGQIGLTRSEGTSVDFEVALGSNTTSDSDGGFLDLTHTGDVMTDGDVSTGSSVQSIGGGGGTLVIDVSTVTADTETEVEKPTQGPPDKVRAAETITPGNEPAKDRSRGTIKVADVASPNDLSISAHSDAGSAIGGQSARAPGAEVSDDTFATIGVADVVAFGDDAITIADARSAGVATVSFGADGGLRNDGGTIDFVFTGDHMTNGTLSPALLVQSIGGGGGDVRLLGLDSVGASFGGLNGASGDGGEIDLVNTGNVFTGGELSHGIVLQSIGGGGGLALTDLDASQLNWSLSSANQGSGGSIVLNQTGDVAVLGNRSIALLAQSLGGGGGVLDREFMGAAGGAGAGGDITVILNGSLLASGDEGIGVFAQSDGADGQGVIDITLNSDHFIYGGANGIAVSLSGGANNLLTNFGTIMTADEIDGLSISGSGGSTQIDNFGWILGNVAFSSGVNAFNNEASGRFSAGSSIDLGSTTSLLTNNGELIPGHSMNAQLIHLNGSFLQSADATTTAEIDFASGATDQLFATGNVDVDGTLDVRLLNTQAIPVGSFSTAVFTGDLGLTDNGLSLNTAPSVVVLYDLSFSDNAALLGYSVDFSADGLGENLAAVGEYINRGQMAGGGNNAYGNIITKLVFDPDLDTYRHSLSQMSPDFYGEHQVQLLNSSIDFGQRLLSCRQVLGEYRIDDNGNCLWAQLDIYAADKDAELDFKAVKGDTRRFSLGVQSSVGSDWSFGFGMSKEVNDSYGYEGNWQSEGYTYHWGLSAARRVENTLWSGIVSYGSSRTNSVRHGDLLGEFRADIAREMDTYSGLLRVSHDFLRTDWYLRPSFSVGVIELRASDAKEQGAGAASLLFVDNNETHVWYQPAIEIGREIEFGSDSRLRFSLELAMQDYMTGSATDVRARLAGAPLEIEPLTVGADLGGPLYRSKFGVDFTTSNNVSTRLFIDSGYYDRSNIDSINLRIEVPLH